MTYWPTAIIFLPYVILKLLEAPQVGHHCPKQFLNTTFSKESPIWSNLFGHYVFQKSTMYVYCHRGPGHYEN